MLVAFFLEEKSFTKQFVGFDRSRFRGAARHFGHNEIKITLGPRHVDVANHANRPTLHRHGCEILLITDFTISRKTDERCASQRLLF